MAKESSQEQLHQIRVLFTHLDHQAQDRWGLLEASEEQPLQPFAKAEQSIGPTVKDPPSVL